MEAQDKDRLLELALGAIWEASESEGIWFINDKEAIEMLTLWNKYDPDPKRTQEMNDSISIMTNPH